MEYSQAKQAEKFIQKNKKNNFKNCNYVAKLLLSQWNQEDIKMYGASWKNMQYIKWVKTGEE